MAIKRMHSNAFTYQGVEMWDQGHGGRNRAYYLVYIKDKVADTGPIIWYIKDVVADTRPIIWYVKDMVAVTEYYLVYQGQGGRHRVYYLVYLVELVVEK